MINLTPVWTSWINYFLGNLSLSFILVFGVFNFNTAAWFAVPLSITHQYWLQFGLVNLIAILDLGQDSICLTGDYCCACDIVFLHTVLLILHACIYLKVPIVQPFQSCRFYLLCGYFHPGRNYRWSNWIHWKASILYNANALVSWIISNFFVVIYTYLAYAHVIIQVI